MPSACLARTARPRNERSPAGPPGATVRQESPGRSGWPGPPWPTAGTAISRSARCTRRWPGHRIAGDSPARPSATAWPDWCRSRPGSPATPGPQPAGTARVVAELLGAYEPESVLGFRNVEPGGVRVDQPACSTAHRVWHWPARRGIDDGHDLGPAVPPGVIVPAPSRPAAGVRADERFVVRAPAVHRAIESAAGPGAARPVAPGSDVAGVRGGEPGAAGRPGAPATGARRRAAAGAALLRYLIRMSTRPTPYGLFAAPGVGTWTPPRSCASTTVPGRCGCARTWAG